ncbi:sensor histidine kinase [Pedobacter hartonius]|nr:HAMP domain-containing sensor histidine kinase [Pedobacter hartonius]
MKSSWVRLTGNPDTHKLEARIFHITCIFTILLFTCSIFFNYLIGLYSLSLLLIPSVFAACGLYYLSKFRHQHSLAVLVFCILGNIVFIIFFLNNSGINGPSLVIYVLFFFLVMSIVPVNQRLIWVGVNITVAILLISYQYRYPEAVPLKHRDGLSRSLDFAYVYFFTLLIVYFIITSIINSYNRERTLAENRAELLELSNQSKNKLFSILAHDLRSPLNSIQSFLELSLDEQLNADERKIIHSSLLRETRYTRQMLVNLLSWSKTQMDGVTVNMVRLDLEETLESTIMMQANLAEEKGIVINNLILKGIYVIADHNMLELVIRNLINNAIKFTDADGEINICSEDHGEECWIKVQDNGVGITEKNERNIFSLQSESTYGTNNEKGVGLGLVLCKEFILLQQGKIWVESISGMGTTFFISLKLAKDLNQAFI